MNPQLVDIEAMVRQAIQQEVQRAKDKIVQIATEDFRQEVRAIVGMVVLKLSDFYSVERMNNELVIHVRIDEGRSGNGR